MDCAGDLVDRLHPADLVHHRHQRGVGDDRALGQAQRVDVVHQIAEDRALSAAGGDGAMAHAFIEPLRQRRVGAEVPDAHPAITQTAAGDGDRIGLPVDLNCGNRVDRAEDALVAKPAEGKVFGRIAQGHEGDEFSLVEIHRQRMFACDRGRDDVTAFVDRIDRRGDRAGLAGQFDRFHGTAGCSNQPPM